MRLNEVTYEAGQPVDGYGPGFFRVAGELHEGGLLLLPAGRLHWAGWDDMALLGAAGAVDVLLLGTGAETAFPPPELSLALDEAGIAFEPMNSPAACRSYNVLLAEGRRVGLAALPV